MPVALAPANTAPTDIRVTGQTDTSITLSWTKGSGATSYKVFRQAVTNGTPSYTRIGDVSTYTFTALQPSTAYRLNVSSQFPSAPEQWGTEIRHSITGTAPPSPPPPAGGFTVGATDREWFDNDVRAQASLGYKLVRYGHVPMTSLHATHYKGKGIKLISLAADSSQWANLRDEWLKYGPNGTVNPGIVIALEVGNEESMPHRCSNPYACGRSHAQAVRNLAAAVPDAPIVCQGDDSWQATPDPRFFNGMRDANPQIVSDCDLYAIHPYGARYRERMDRNRGHINDILNDDGAPFAVTEYGVAVRANGGCITDDSTYGCITLAQAADRLRTVVNYIKSRGDVRYLTIYQNTDQQAGSGAREHNFGLLTNTHQPKGAYTTAAKELIARTPSGEQPTRRNLGRSSFLVLVAGLNLCRLLVLRHAHVLSPKPPPAGCPRSRRRCPDSGPRPSRSNPEGLTRRRRRPPTGW